MKRPSLLSTMTPKKLNAPADASEPTEDRPSRTPRKEAPPYKSVLAKIDNAAHRELKILSANEDTPMGDLLVEGLNLLFRARGMPEIAVKVTPDETGKPRR